jgi:hypothetical protein
LYLIKEKSKNKDEIKSSITPKEKAVPAIIMTMKEKKSAFLGMAIGKEPKPCYLRLIEHRLRGKGAQFCGTMKRNSPQAP